MDWQGEALLAQMAPLRTGRSAETWCDGQRNRGLTLGNEPPVEEKYININ